MNVGRALLCLAGCVAFAFGSILGVEAAAWGLSDVPGWMAGLGFIYGMCVGVGGMLGTISWWAP